MRRGTTIALAAVIASAAITAPAEADPRADAEALTALVGPQLVGAMALGAVDAHEAARAYHRGNRGRENEVLEIVQAQVDAVFRENETALLRHLVDAHLAVYSAEELTSMRAYYSSPLGRSVLEKSTEFTSTIRGAARDWASGMRGEVRARVTDAPREAGLRVYR